MNFLLGAFCDRCGSCQGGGLASRLARRAARKDRATALRALRVRVRSAGPLFCWGLFLRHTSSSAMNSQRDMAAVSCDSRAFVRWPAAAEGNKTAVGSALPTADQSQMEYRLTWRHLGRGQDANRHPSACGVGADEQHHVAQIDQCRVSPEELSLVLAYPEHAGMSTVRGSDFRPKSCGGPVVY